MEAPSLRTDVFPGEFPRRLLVQLFLKLMWYLWSPPLPSLGSAVLIEELICSAATGCVYDLNQCGSRCLLPCECVPVLRDQVRPELSSDWRAGCQIQLAGDRWQYCSNQENSRSSWAAVPVSAPQRPTNVAGEEQGQGGSEPASLQYAYQGFFGWHLYMFDYMWPDPTLRNVLVGVRMTLSSNIEASEKPQKQQKVNKYLLLSSKTYSSVIQKA